MAFQRNSDEFQKTVDAVARQLVAVKHRGGMSFITTPMTYPSGTSVVVRIADGGTDFFVSDFGAGYAEAEMMGGTATYVRQARGISDASGIDFDSHSFFIVHADQNRLPGAVTLVANCSRDAVAATAFAIAERRVAEDSNALYDRLVHVFTPPRVSRDVEIMGRSTTKWHFAALVQGPRPAVFEPVSSHHSSVFAAATKFDDLASLDDPPSRVAVVRSKEELKSYLAVISRHASVIETRVPDATISALVA